jgi:hypothetical protein
MSKNSLIFYRILPWTRPTYYYYYYVETELNTRSRTIDPVFCGAN